MSNITSSDLLLIGFKEVESEEGYCFQRGELKLKFSREYIEDLDPTIIKSAYLESLTHYILPNYSLEQIEAEIERKINGEEKFIDKVKAFFKRK